jgi:hypothetical protein
MKIIVLNQCQMYWSRKSEVGFRISDLGFGIWDLGFRIYSAIRIPQSAITLTSDFGLLTD